MIFGNPVLGLTKATRRSSFLRLSRIGAGCSNQVNAVSGIHRAGTDVTTSGLILLRAPAPGAEVLRVENDAEHIGREEAQLRGPDTDDADDHAVGSGDHPSLPDFPPHQNGGENSEDARDVVETQQCDGRRLESAQKSRDVSISPMQAGFQRRVRAPFRKEREWDGAPALCIVARQFSARSGGLFLRRLCPSGLSGGLRLPGRYGERV
jgi:hypothetical protein